MDVFGEEEGGGGERGGRGGGEAGVFWVFFLAVDCAQWLFGLEAFLFNLFCFSVRIHPLGKRKRGGRDRRTLLRPKNLVFFIVVFIWKLLEKKKNAAPSSLNDERNAPVPHTFEEWEWG